MRHNLVVGNWKMYGSKASIAELVGGLKERLDKNLSASVAVCPPFVFVPQAVSLLADSNIGCGAQNLSEHAEGAYTGEISAAMLADIGCDYVIIGHSERRTMYGEDDQQVAAKFSAAQAAGLTPILCVGESLEQREAGDTLGWIEGQLRAVIDEVGIGAFASAVVAYEPIWAIGTGKTATPEQAQEVHAHIRRVMAEADEVTAERLQILYGGSVKAGNASELFAKEDIDGALVGGASLKATDFAAICSAAV